MEQVTWIVNLGGSMWDLHNFTVNLFGKFTVDEKNQVCMICFVNHLHEVYKTVDNKIVLCKQMSM